jgi:hypothetical protein
VHLAQQYYKKPAALGGGGNVFDASNGGPGFTIPPKLALSGTGATWSPAVDAQTVTLTSTTVPNSGYTWTVQVDVTPDSIKTTILNP